MTIEIFTVCDYCQDNSGKLNIIGPFDTIFVKSFPVRHPVFGIAGRLLFDKGEKKKSSLGIKVLTPENENLIEPVHGDLSLNNTEHGELKHINIAIINSNVKFEKPGVYTVQLLINDSVIREIRINLVKR